MVQRDEHKDTVRSVLKEGASNGPGISTKIPLRKIKPTARKMIFTQQLL
jgi:hypothetical protein